MELYNMKERYETPETDIIEFETADVITESGELPTVLFP